MSGESGDERVPQLGFPVDPGSLVASVSSGGQRQYTEDVRSSEAQLFGVSHHVAAGKQMSHTSSQCLPAFG